LDSVASSPDGSYLSFRWSTGDRLETRIFDVATKTSTFLAAGSVECTWVSNDRLLYWFTGAPYTMSGTFAWSPP
jgi:hypothetical protein